MVWRFEAHYCNKCSNCTVHVWLMRDVEWTSTTFSPVINDAIMSHTPCVGEWLFLPLLSLLYFCDSFCSNLGCRSSLRINLYIITYFRLVWYVSRVYLKYCVLVHVFILSKNVIYFLCLYDKISIFSKEATKQWCLHK